MVNISTLPDGYVTCSWCDRAVRLRPDGTCPSCGLTPDQPTGKRTPRTGPTRRERMGARIAPLGLSPVGKPVLGIDPGWRNVGVVLRDGDVALHATTLVRPATINQPVPWAQHVLDSIKVLLFQHCPANTRIAIEGVTAPKGYANGKRAPIDPGPILFTGVVVGILAGAFPTAHIVEPGGNGSQHMTHYPPTLRGRRPPDLPGSDNGADTREHTRSAYDIAGKATKHLHPAPPRTPLEIT